MDDLVSGEQAYSRSMGLLMEAFARPMRSVPLLAPTFAPILATVEELHGLSLNTSAAFTAASSSGGDDGGGGGGTAAVVRAI